MSKLQKAFYFAGVGVTVALAVLVVVGAVLAIADHGAMTEVQDTVQHIVQFLSRQEH